MKVSVILPVHNGQRFIFEALACLARQTLPPAEVVVVDDGSSDDTARLVHDYQLPGLRYLHQAQSGPAAARNAGLAAARGEAMAFLDADDLLCPGHLARAVDCLRGHPEVGIAQGLIQRMRWREGRFHHEGGPYQFVNLGSIVVRREVFEKTGDFSADMWENEDTDWFMKAWEQSIPKRLIAQVSLFYRLHDTNMVHSQQLQAGGVATLMARHLRRMRAAGASTQKVLHRVPWDLYRGSPEQEVALETLAQPVVELRMGMGWLARGRLAQAARHFQRCLDLDPGQAQARQELSRVQDAQRDEQLICQPHGRLCLFNQKRFPSHRSGWGYALDALQPLHNRRGHLFDGFLENNFAWRYPHEGVRSPEIVQQLRRDGLLEQQVSSEELGLVPYRQSWIGFLHNPPDMPPGFHDHATPQAILARRIWQESLEHCRGLFTLSEYMAGWLREQTGLPVQALWQPTETPQRVFDPQRFLDNPSPKIVQVGWWLRRLTSIYRLPVYQRYQKVWLVTLPFAQARNHFLHLMESEGGRPSCPNTMEIEQLSDQDYDRMLAENLVFVHLYDASANNALVECLARGTPILINPHPAVVEYLGEAYPLYFDSLSEAAEKALDLPLVLQAHEYMLQLPLRQKLSGASFCSHLESTSIYQSLAVPGFLSSR